MWVKKVMEVGTRLARQEVDMATNGAIEGCCEAVSDWADGLTVFSEHAFLRQRPVDNGRWGRFFLEQNDIALIFTKNNIALCKQYITTVMLQKTTFTPMLS